MDPEKQTESREDNDSGNGDDFISSRQRVIEEFEEFERDFRSNKPVSWLASLLGPLVITLIILGVIWSTCGFALTRNLVGNALATFFAFGRLIILSGAESGEASTIRLPPGQLFWMVTYMDFMTALFVAFHMGFIFRIPYLGKMLTEFVGDGQFLLRRNPWIKKIAFAGLVVFVIFPTSTTGSVGGSIFGRLLGLGRWTTISAIGIGSLLGNGLMYFLSATISRSELSSFTKNPWIVWGTLLLLVGFFVCLERYYRSMKRRYIEEEQAARNSSDSDDE